jgi:Zn-finger nucleic acid-binding protein
MRTAEMVCPKCGGGMRAYERNGITIDQCTGCRGVFLDRGELERLIDAEVGVYGDRDPAPVDERPQGGAPESPKRRKRGGFLGDLFELGE